MPTVSIAIIQELIATGRIVEARTLLAADGSLLNPEEQDACLLEIDRRQGQAAAMVAQAEEMEQSGRSEEAKALYMSVLEIAADFPGIQEHIKRMDEALFLARAVQRRNKRIRESVSQKGNKKRAWLRPALGSGLVMGLAAAALILVLNKPTSPPASAPEPASPHNPLAAATQQVAQTPAPIISANPVPPVTTTTESTPALPPPESPTEPSSITTQTTSEPHPVAPSPPITGPIPAPHPSAPNPMAEQPAEKALPARSSETSVPDELYTVQPGDSLSQIAAHQLCHEPSWRALHHLNRDRITDPSKLQPGMQLRLTGLESHCPARP